MFLSQSAFQLGHIAEAIQQCTEVLENSDPNDVDVLCDRAEAYLLDERYDEGEYFEVF